MKTIKIKRKIESTLLKIKELKEFKGKRVELLIKVNELVSDKSKKETESLAGALAEYTNTNLIDKEKSGWEFAVREKHENYRR